MAKVDMQTELNVAADQVWALIGGFNTLPDWHPSVEKSELQEEGSVRTISLVGGGSITEKLEKIDEKERMYSYSIVEGSLPVSNYTSIIRVQEKDDGKTVVSWSGEFNPKMVNESEALETITNVYQTGLDNLKKIFGG